MIVPQLDTPNPAPPEQRTILQTCLYNSWIPLLAVVFFLLAEWVSDKEVVAGKVVLYSGFLSNTCVEIAEALIVAYIIVISIEYHSRIELNKIIAKFLVSTHSHLFQAIMGVQFPIEVFDLVRDRLMKDPAYRVGTEVHFTIKDIEENPPKQFGIDTVIIEMLCRYTVKNLSDGVYTHPLRFFVEKNEPEQNHTLSLSIDGKELDQAQIIAADAAWEDRPGLKRFEIDVEIAKGEEKRIVAKLSERRLIADTYTWKCLHPCDGLRISITYPRELKVFSNSIHADDLEYIEINEHHQIAKISRPLFPANGFMFWWTPREPDRVVPDTVVK